MKNSLNKISSIKQSTYNLGEIFIYMILITTYSLTILIRFLSKKISFLKKFESFLLRLIKPLDKPKENTLPKTELINIAIKNMLSKKNRFFVTVGGMTIGIAAIVFLVSIGYGLQSLVIDRVARLEEMKQADVSVLPGSNLILNDEAIESFNKVQNVELSLPQIAAVAKVNFNNSMTDMAAYGVTRGYLEQSAISPVIGDIFQNNETKTDITALTEETQEIEEQDITEEILTGDTVIVEGESDTEATLKVSRVIFPESIKDREAVVNRSFLKVLGIDESEALGETFSVSFISINKTLSENQDKIESTAVDYVIIGVTPDDLTPLFYVPLIHLKALGINNYSQVKVVVDDEKNLDAVRTTIEAQGFTSSSVVDTVAQINGLFSTARTVLALLGTIALFVASFGMFNTLTVSLLERTREIGLLKAMVMKSNEVRDLFLAESMIMGSLGGLLGIILGLVVGKLIELLISIYALLNGVGTISIVDMPILFVILIILISFLVGILTGIYPARRATKISALNALRYE